MDSSPEVRSVTSEGVEETGQRGGRPWVTVTHGPFPSAGMGVPDPWCGGDGVGFGRAAGGRETWRPPVEADPRARRDNKEGGRSGTTVPGVGG